MNKKEQKELIEYLRADLAAARNLAAEGITRRIRMTNTLRVMEGRVASLEEELEAARNCTEEARIARAKAAGAVRGMEDRITSLEKDLAKRPFTK